jgi:hypothetical protein
MPIRDVIHHLWEWAWRQRRYLQQTDEQISCNRVIPEHFRAFAHAKSRNIPRATAENELPISGRCRCIL